MGYVGNVDSKEIVPGGQLFQADGVIEVNVVVGVEDKTWSGVKSLYNK